MADIIKDDFIKRSNALELAREYYTPALRESAVPVRAIKNIPSADVVEVKHSTWLAKDFHTVYCEECKYEIDLMKILHTGLMQHLFYCPNCGTDMRMDGGA
jgi:RNase P subunit RPR2